MKQRIVVGLLFVYVLLLLGCQSPEPQNNVASDPTTAVATNTATAVPTPEPTATPIVGPIATAVVPVTAPDVIVPKVRLHVPPSKLTKQRKPQIELRLNQPMDQESVQNALSSEPPLELAVRVEENSVFIQVLDTLAFDINYLFTLADVAESQAGVTLKEKYTWRLQLKPPIQIINGPSKHNPDRPITIKFNYPMAASSVSASLKIDPEVSGQLSWSDDHKIATFAPDRELQPETIYSVRFEGEVFDVDGDPLPLLEAGQFTTPPSILSRSPEGNDVQTVSVVNIYFDRLMDQAATEAAVQIEPQIAGKFTWRETRLIFEPIDGYFDENTTYTVTVDPSALSVDGDQILTEAESWSFTTGKFREFANFGYGPNAQLVDVDGRRAIQYQTAFSPQKEVTFELYRLDLDQFLEMYASNFKYSPDEEIDTAGAELIKQWSVETTKSIARDNNVQELIIPDDIPPGLYILNLETRRLDDQLILILTANSLAVKEADGQIVAWLTDINGTQAANKNVGVFARNGELLAQGLTDGDGIFRTQLPAFEEGGPPAFEPLIVVAQSGIDYTVSGLSYEWQNSAGYRNYWWNNTELTNSAAYIYTERPIYKPGQTVFFKGVLRKDDDAVLSNPPADTPVTVRVRDGRNNVVQTFELATNDFGSINGSFDLAEGAMLGEYQVEVVFEGTAHSQIFRVEDYRKPDYEVTVVSDSEKYLAGDEIQITVDSAYYFGEPVPNADVIIRRFNTGWWEDYRSQYEPIRGKTDANGRFTYTIPVTNEDIYDGNADWGSNLGQRTIIFEATVDDGSHQTVSGFAPVTLYSNTAYVTANTDGYVQEPGRPFTVSADVVTIFDEPVADSQLRIELRRWRAKSYDYDDVVQSATMTTDVTGEAVTEFTIEEPGYYQLRVSGQDADNRKIFYNRYVYAFSDFYSNWYGRNDGGIRIDTAEESYQPGDTAQLIVETTISGPALLTIERGTVRREELVQLTAPVTLLDLPIEAEDVPNLYVALNIWEALDTTIQENTSRSLADGRLHTAHHNISVPATTKELMVTITPDKEQYAPRDEATFTVRVTNYKGEPVSAEVSLALVDEAIFALSEDLSGTAYDAFYYERDSLVNTYNGLQLSRYFWEGGMGGGGDGDAPPGTPRADFPDTAAWFPVLYTDFNGETAVTITLPDNLTTWRMTAQAVTADTQVGEAIVNMITWQPIIVQPLLPRALTTSDTTILSTLLHNYSDLPQKLDVTLVVDPTHLTLLEPVTKTVALDAGASQIVGWPLDVLAAGETEILVTAVAQSLATQGSKAQNESILNDAVQLSLTINPLAIPDVQTQVGDFVADLASIVDVPEDALPMSMVKIQLSRSIAGTMLEGLDYLTGFPYGCVEQTMSKALPNAVVGRALNQLGVSDPTLEATLPGHIRASIQRLYAFQHTDGGWGWWFDDNTHDYQTAWVVFGLAQIAEAGYEIDPAVIERGAAWLDGNLHRMDSRTRAFALYVLIEAGHPNTKVARELVKDLDVLQGDVFSLSALALTLDQINEKEMAREIIAGLAETAVVKDGSVHWQGDLRDGNYKRKTMASDVRSTALALSAFTQIAPQHELNGGIVRWLMAQRRSQGWGSTNETSFAILGLTDHLLATAFNDDAAVTNYAVTLNGSVFATGTLGKGAPSLEVVIPQDQLQSGQNEILMTQDGGRPLYYSIISRMYIPQANIEAAGDIAIERTYHDLQTGAELETITAGQLVQVRLSITLPEDGSYMIVEDKLPGGLEALNADLNTQSRVTESYYGVEHNPFMWRSFGYNYKEIFGDRVSFFITDMAAGEHQYSYNARATLSGEFVALPTEAGAMYDATMWGRSASDQIIVIE